MTPEDLIEARRILAIPESEGAYPSEVLMYRFARALLAAERELKEYIKENRCIEECGSHGAHCMRPGCPGWELELEDTQAKVMRDAKGANGLTHDEIAVACRNIGYDMTCGACAEVFYTGSTAHAHTCDKLAAGGHMPEVKP